MDEQQKAQVRAQMAGLFDQAVGSIHSTFVLRAAPYLDGPYNNHRGGTEMRYYKAWDLWEPGDLMRTGHDNSLDPRVIRVLRDMAEADDFGHLNQVLPSYYRGRGGVQAFQRDIEAGARNHGIFGANTVTAPGQPLHEFASLTVPAQGQRELASLDQLVRNAGQLATNITSHGTSDLLPATVRAASSLVRAA